MELRDKGEKSLGESTDCNLSARDEQDTSNEELSAGPYKKLNVHKRFFSF